MKTKLQLVLIIILSFTILSCNRRSQLLYVQNIEVEEEVPMIKPPIYRLRQGDILIIQLMTPSPEISQAFNNPTGSQYLTRSQDESSLFLSGYTVDEEGMITLPFLGQAKVIGLTINEAKAEIQTLTERMYKDASVIIKLASFRITVMGEVRRPGNIRTFSDQLSIFEALASVGDISENGDRKNVLIIRPTSEGNKTYRLNLNDKKVLTSEAYFLQPNDMVIVEPIGNKIFQMNVPYITLTFSTLSTLILLYNFISKL